MDDGQAAASAMAYLESCNKFGVQPQLLVIELLTHLPHSSPRKLHLPSLGDGDVEALCAILPSLPVKLEELALANGCFGIRGGKIYRAAELLR